MESSQLFRRRVGRRGLLKAGLAAGLGVSVSGGQPRGWRRAAAQGSGDLSEINIVSGAEISTLDPTQTNDMEAVSVISGITNKLVRMSSTTYGQVDPLLATSWEAIEPTRWRFALRDDVKFHNGAQFNAETAKWSIENYAANAVFKIVIEPVDHVEIVDTYTIDIVTKYPTGLIPLMLNAGAEQLEPNWMTSSDYSPEKLVGTGPAKFVEWVKGQHILLEANDEYWGGRLSYDRARHRAIPESATRANAAIAGEGHIFRNIPPRDVERVRSADGMDVRVQASNRVVSIRIRDDIAPFDNPLVRQALNYAVDVPAIVDNVLLGYGEPVRGQIQGPVARNWQEDVQPYPHDPEKAKSLLAEAGVPNGITTKIGSPRGRDQGDYEFVQALAGQLQEVGIEAEVILHEAGDYQAIYSGQEEAEPLFYYSSGNIIPDAENAFRDLLSPRSYVMRSPELQAIYDELKQTVDDAERARLSREGILLIREYAPVIFGYQLEQAYGVADGIDWTPLSFEWILLDQIKVPQ